MVKQIVSIKFGGTSMGDGASIFKSANAVLGSLKKEKQVVVTVSAVSGATDRLVALVDFARRKKKNILFKKLNDLVDLHKEILKEIVGLEAFETEWAKRFRPLADELSKILHGASLVGDVTDKTIAKILSFGEKMSSHFMVLALESLGYASRRVLGEELIKTDSRYLEANVNYPRTTKVCRRIINPLLKGGIIPVVTGFIGQDSKGDTTLLGRGGSDYTGAIIAVCMNMERFEIWTDVDGVMSSDPRLHSKCISWRQLSMDVVCEMAFSGAKVVHPKSISIATSRGLPVTILNTFNPSFPGTEINSSDEKGVKGIILDKDFILIHVKNPKMLNSVGFIAEFTSFVASLGVSIDVFATAETSFTFSIKKQFFSPKLEKRLSKFAQVSVKREISKIAVIGNRITEDLALMSAIFGVFKEKDVFIETLSMNYSKTNVTLLVEEKEAKKMLIAMHEVFFERA